MCIYIHIYKERERERERLDGMGWPPSLPKDIWMDTFIS